MNLYVKYRPKSLEEVYGNEEAILVLRDLLKDKENFPSAILFFGPSGCGKTTLARILKKELGCGDQDFMELNVANTRGIDTIREVIAVSAYVPVSGKVRIFLFDECARLTYDAQSALLKVLEDTPEGVYFFLCTTDLSGVIPTVRNRCLGIQVHKLSVLALTSLLKKVCRLEGKSVDVEVLNEIARMSDGSPRQALVLLEEVLNCPKEKALKVLEENVGDEEVKVAELCKVLIRKGVKDWKKVSQMVDGLEGDSEKIRIAILGYLSRILMKDEDERIAKMMELFLNPVYSSGKGGLVLAVWKACKI